MALPLLISVSTNLALLSQPLPGPLFQSEGEASKWSAPWAGASCALTMTTNESTEELAFTSPDVTQLESFSDIATARLISLDFNTPKCPGVWNKMRLTIHLMTWTLESASGPPSLAG